MRKRPRQNNNPNDRFKNSTLLTIGVLHGVATAVIGALISVVPFALIDGSENVAGELSFPLFLAVGAVVALAVWTYRWPKYARKTRANFIKAGGDPTGMTLFMFGAMGGRLREDGTWEWVINELPDEYDTSSENGEDKAS